MPRIARLRPVHLAGLLAAGLALGRLTAAATDASLDLRYAIEVAGLPIADLALVVTETGGGTHSRLVMESVGLAAAWSGARSELVSIMRRDGTGWAAPLRFDARHSKHDRERAIAIRYDPNGAIADLEVMSQGKPRRSEVPEALRRDTIDPLTALERLRAWVEAAAAGAAEPFVRLAIFDGRKRLDLEARYVGMVAANGPREGALHELSVRLLGRFGFDEEDSFIELPDGERPAPLRVLVSPDHGLAPLRIETPDRPAGPVITLVRDCRQERCPPPPG